MKIEKNKKEKIVYTLRLSYGPNIKEEYKEYCNIRKEERSIISDLIEYL